MKNKSDLWENGSFVLASGPGLVGFSRYLLLELRVVRHNELLMRSTLHI